MLIETESVIDTRPKLTYAVAQLAQLIGQSFTSDADMTMNMEIRKIKRDQKRRVIHRKLDLDTLHIRMYSDGSLAKPLAHHHSLDA